MSRHKPMVDEEGEVRELTLEDMKTFKPIHEAGLPDSLNRKLAQVPYARP